MLKVPALTWWVTVAYAVCSPMYCYYSWLHLIQWSMGERTVNTFLVSPCHFWRQFIRVGHMTTRITPPVGQVAHAEEEHGEITWSSSSHQHSYTVGGKRGQFCPILMAPPWPISPRVKKDCLSARKRDLHLSELSSDGSSPLIWSCFKSSVEQRVFSKFVPTLIHFSQTCPVSCWESGIFKLCGWR